MQSSPQIKKQAEKEIKDWDRLVLRMSGLAAHLLIKAAAIKDPQAKARETEKAARAVALTKRAVELRDAKRRWVEGLA